MTLAIGAPRQADQLSIRIQVEIEVWKLIPTMSTPCVPLCPSCKLALFSSGTLMSGCSHTSESQSVSGSEDGPQGCLSCAVSGPGRPALTPGPSCAVSAVGPALPRWQSPTWSRLVGLRPPSSLSQPPTGGNVAPRIRVSVVSSRWHPAGRVRPCMLFRGPDLHSRGLARCTAALPTLPRPGPHLPLTTLLFPASRTLHCGAPRWPRPGPHLPLTTLSLQPTGQHHGHGYHLAIQ